MKKEGIIAIVWIVLAFSIGVFLGSRESGSRLINCHKDKINIYRSCIAGNGFNLGARLESRGKNLVESQNTENKVITHTSSIIYNEAIEYEKVTKEKFRKVSKKEIT